MLIDELATGGILFVFIDALLTILSLIASKKVTIAEFTSYTYHSFAIASALKLGFQFLMVNPSSFSTQQNPEDLGLAVLVVAILLIGVSIVELWFSIKKICRPIFKKKRTKKPNNISKFTMDNL